MKTGLIDSQGRFHEVDYYEIQNLCEVMVQAAINKSPVLRKVFEEKFANKITRFSKELEFCLHILGWMVYDPFALGRDEVLFSNGERSYIASSEVITKPGFDRTKIKNNNLGFPILTDEVVGFDSTLNHIENYNKGIIDERGYVDASFVPTLKSLADIILMHDMIKDKELYEEFTSRGKNNHHPLDFLTARKNVIAIKKLDNGKYMMHFADENDGRVLEFIDKMEIEDRIEKLEVLEQGERKLAA